MDLNSENTIIYTVLIGQNEGLNLQPEIKNSKLRHVCLTDNENLKSDDWEMIYVKSLLPMDKHRSQRNLKIRPHLIFPEYKYSFYFDNTIVFKCNVETFIRDLFERNSFNKIDPLFLLPYHSFRDNLIAEFYECFNAKLDNDLIFFEQISDYLKINSLAMKDKPYWGGMLLRNHMHAEVKEFSEIWFSNVLRYSKRDQLSIIHSALQAKLKINGFHLDNHSSIYHEWPIIKQKRINRISQNNIYKLPQGFFEDIVVDFSHNDEEIKNIDFHIKIKKAFLKFQKSFNEFNNLEEEKKNLEEERNNLVGEKKNLEEERNNLVGEKKNLEEEKNDLELELTAIKRSRIWRSTSIIRMILDKLRFIFSKSIIFFALNNSIKIGLKLKFTSLSKFKIGRFIVDVILFPSDIYKVCYSFKKSFGKYPNIISPRTFNEKIQKRKLLNRSNFHILFADKLAVRNYVAKTIGKEYLNRLIWSGDRLHNFVDKEKLPNQFIIKTNNSSGTNLICSDKSKFDWNFACNQIDDWLKYDHSIAYAEWQYRWIKPMVLIEEFLEDEKGKLPDYKFFCFAGKVKLIQIDYDRFSDHKRLLLNRDLVVIDVGFVFPQHKGNPCIPMNIKLMIDLAEKLAYGVDFVRVDLYALPNKIVFGELTFAPEAGIGRFHPGSFDLELGKEFNN